MSTRTDMPAGEAIIRMTRIFDAPRMRVWEAMTQPRHVRQWWGGPGFRNPVCEMDVRPGGLWHHVMVFPDGQELAFDFVFLAVEPPQRLVWQNADHGARKDGPPTCRIVVALDDLGAATRWTMTAQFDTPAARAAAAAMGFTRPIESSNDGLDDHLKTM